MEKNSKGQVIIRSIDELSPSQQKEVNKASMRIACLFVLIYFLGWLFLSDLFPDNEIPLIFICVKVMVCFGVSIVPFVYGKDLGMRMKLADMGYAFPKRSYSGDYYHAPHQPYSSSDSSGHSFSGNYGSSSSINPSSGLPMSGSSGVDTSGNPYGTRSW